MRKCNILLLTACLALTGCGAVRHESSEIRTETTEAVQITTESVKVAENAPQRASAVSVTVAPEEVRRMKREMSAATEAPKEAPTEAKKEAPVPSGGHLTRSGGVYYFNGHKETWYSTHEASGQATAVPIPGKHADSSGIIRDADGYICVASSDYRIYTVLETSWGPAKVYDTGCSHGTIDVYTTW